MDIITAKKIYLSYSMLPYIKGTINDKLNYPQKPIFGYRIPLKIIYGQSEVKENVGWAGEIQEKLDWG